MKIEINGGSVRMRGHARILHEIPPLGKPVTSERRGNV